MAMRVKEPSYKKHLVRCPACGREVLDHMTACPFCQAALAPSGYSGAPSEKLTQVRRAANIAGLLIAAALLLLLFLKK